MVAYSDDGLLFPETANREPGITNSAYGVFKHPEKSGWVKKNGKWLKPLKFLGFTYHPPVRLHVDWVLVCIHLAIARLID